VSTAPGASPPGPQLRAPRRWGRFAARRLGLLAALVTAAWLGAFALAAGGMLRPRPAWGWAFAASLLLLVAAAVWVQAFRERAVREAALPQFLKRKLREQYPHLTGKDCDLVERGLRQFFLACLRSRGKFVAMPSRVVDTMWHEFILHTRGYRDWCDLTLGRFLHHTPAEVLGARAAGNDGLRRAWYFACRDEAIDPRKPTRLPLLFALDGKLAIEGGFSYVPDCRDIERKNRDGGDGGPSYCGTSFADGSHSGDGDTFGGAESSGGDGADGGGCGGD
jgi:hypothetical protein